MDVLTEKLLREREDLVARAEIVKRNASDQNRDLNDADRSALATYRSRVTELDGQLKDSTFDFGLDTEVANRISQLSGAPVVKRGANPWDGMTAGDVLFDFLHIRSNPGSEARVTAWQQYHQQNRAAQHMGTTAAATTPTAGGFGGLIITPNVGPVINLTPTESPMLGLLGVQDSGNALTFQRPRIVDPNFATAAGPQAGGKEKGELPSVAFDVKAESVALSTIGNYLNLSLQAETFVGSALDLLIAQLTARTVYGLETSVGTVLTGATKVVAVAAPGGSAEVLTAWQQAAAAVFQATRRPPQWAVAGIAGWAKLSGLSDAAGRPLFPNAGAAVNALGTGNGASSMTLNVNGIPLTVSLGITDDSVYMGNSFGLEVYLYRFPMLQAVEPSVLGRQVAVAASIGTYQPPTTEAGPGGTPAAKHEGIVKIDFP